jgi:hypothetical protein
MGQGVANAVGPPVLGLVCLGWGEPGWLVVGAFFLLAGQVIPLVVKWSDHTRAEIA